MSSSVAASASGASVPTTVDLDEIDFDRRFGGIGRLYGAAALSRFLQAHVCVVGVGGSVRGRSRRWRVAPSAI
ncbi:dinucleotide-utilizing enzymes involved in molybdopterin and thiamine biosynthesis family 1 domain protein [Collimonas arenae]|nr:dinucleotide-utilizing enzymes involved in molybdopterin and thiamine biosynthesis family 1 domain protein [Collimonas arenae]